MSTNYKSEKVYLGLHSFGDDAIMYVLIDDKSLFDLIALPENGNVAVRHKSLLDGPQRIVFQHWFPAFKKIDFAFRKQAWDFRDFVDRKNQRPVSA